MKPVTELYEAALHLDLANLKTLARLDAALDVLSKRDPTNDRALLGVLDLVATLPPERLGLVRWVAGLPPETVHQIRNLMQASLEEGGDETTTNSAAEYRLRDALRGLEDAFSASKGEAKCSECQGQGYHEVEHVSETERVLDTDKCETCDGTGENRTTCPECHDTGKVKRLEGGGSIRVVKFDPCPKCAEGEGGAKEEATEDRDPNGHRWARGSEGAELCADCGVDLQDDEALRECGAILDKRTVLPVGKPPPFLRVGMRLWEPVMRQVCKWTVEALQEKEVVVRCEHGSRCAFPLDSMPTWPLAEPFTVEGES